MISWLIAVVVVLLLFLAAEGVSRMMVRRSPYYTWPPNYRMDLHLDPQVKIAGQTVVRVRSNERGERGGPVDAEAFQVLAVGGSAVECYLLDEPLTWTSVVEQKLKSSGMDRVRVGNIGMSGADSCLLHTFLGYVSPNYKSKLDVIIIMVGASDVLLWLTDGAPNDWKGDPNRHPLNEYFRAHPEVPLSWTVRGLGLTELWRRIRSRSKVDARHNVGKSLIKVRQFRQRAKRMISDTGSDPGQMFSRFRKYLALSIDQCKAISHRVIVVSQPCFTLPSYTAEQQQDFWNGSIGDPYKAEPEAYYTAELIADLMAQLRDHTRDGARAAGVEFVDATSTVVPNDRDHYNDQFHFKPVGAARLAEKMTEAILARK
jgi:lysophospholipase L1-like esterase